MKINNIVIGLIFCFTITKVHAQDVNKNDVIQPRKNKPSILIDPIQPDGFGFDVVRDNNILTIPDSLRFDSTLFIKADVDIYVDSFGVIRSWDLTLLEFTKNGTKLLVYSDFYIRENRMEYPKQFGDMVIRNYLQLLFKYISNLKIVRVNSPNRVLEAINDIPLRIIFK